MKSVQGMEKFLHPSGADNKIFRQISAFLWTKNKDSLNPQMGVPYVLILFTVRVYFAIWIHVPS